MSLLLSTKNVDKAIRELQNKINQEKLQNHELFKDIVQQSEQPYQTKHPRSRNEVRSPAARTQGPATSLPGIRHASEQKQAALERIQRMSTRAQLPAVGTKDRSPARSSLSAAGSGFGSGHIDAWPVQRDTSIQWPKSGSALSTTPFRLQYPPAASSTTATSLTQSQAQQAEASAIARHQAQGQPEISWQAIEREIRGIKSLILKKISSGNQPVIQSVKPTITSEKPTITSERPTITSEKPTITSEKPDLQQGLQAASDLAVLNSKLQPDGNIGSVSNATGILWPQQAESISWPAPNESTTGNAAAVVGSGKSREYTWPGTVTSEPEVKMLPLHDSWHPFRDVKFASSGPSTTSRARQPTAAASKQPKSIWEAVHVQSVAFFLSFGFACFAIGIFTGARWCLPSQSEEATVLSAPHSLLPLMRNEQDLLHPPAERQNVLENAIGNGRVP
ncbi:hypothetical protein GUITHDRAFT_132494 [Guillardia theta CCMP2712]|uniref:Uncharacterized protein n=1 Tax=Guillardia theta (strain CCMP2712) TaxID=905079 RepID=L1K0D9_GUITC|nr:hypothetical protein GUITHDRAFT_132494 [Guillardia theta CCMP2712]EKX54092.1 hypothetical protein GUITHDRAFT_132494 [Guillardia theta CCMP2712]|eukprot:XP_005841072.1 hypothetical protein GUITHDRAFT_132494 [Guillardia theta CCMP2712]